MKRQQFILLGAVSALAAAGSCLYHYGNNVLHVVHYEMKSDIQRPLKIVHLSDLHNKQYGKRQQNLIGPVMSFGADLIAVTGDMINGRGSTQKDLEEVVQFLSAFKDYAPVLYVMGNHEHYLSGKQLAVFRQMLTEHHIILLSNEMISLRAEGQPVTVLGMDEKEESSVDKHTLLRDFESRDGFRLLLCHYPGKFALEGEDSFQNFCFDLMLAGHSHGGQVVLPGVGGLYSPDQGLFPKYYRGMYGDIPRMIVSGGLGSGSAVPRVFNRPELVCITVSPNRE